MLTDDDLDRRLASAGSAWRDVHPDEADVQFAPRRRPGGALLIAAAVVVALAVALPLAWLGREDRTSLGSARTLNGTWVLRSANGGSTADDYFTLFFTDGRMAFSDGMNTGVGPVQVDGNQLVFGDLTQTTIGGTGSDPVREAVDSTLTGTAHWSIHGDELTVTHADNRLVYLSEQALLSQLVSTRWHLSSFSAGNTVAIMGADYPATFRNGRFVVGTSHDCLALAGALRIDRNELFFSAEKNTVCTGTPGWKGMIWVPAVAEVFRTKAMWSIDDGRLTLASGSAALNFTAS